MFNKKTFTLVDEKKQRKMYSAKNVKWIKYLVLGGLAAFIFLMIFANVKSKSYYRDLKVSKKSVDEKNSGTGTRSISLGKISTRAIECKMVSCNATCSGDMTGLSKYLALQKGCTPMMLKISDCTFPNDRLHIDWLEGTFSLSFIAINRCSLSGIDDGAFNQVSTAGVKSLELKSVQISNLTENTFVGLKALENFILKNEIEKFYGESFLKPMMKTLKKVVIEHVTDIATDPGPWLLGGNFPQLIGIYLDGSNLGGFVKASTFQHLKELSIVTMNSCKITSIADGTFDFIMKQIVVLISLQDNQLKRLAGEYLSKVSSIKLVILNNNPWNCNCELDELITNYKEHPKGFDENVKCRTPAALAGKLFKDVVVDKCEDTTTMPTTISTTVSTLSTTHSTTLSTTPMTIPSTPTSTAQSTTEFETSTSSDLSDSSTPAFGSSTTLSTTELTNPIDEGETSTSPQTTPSPQNRTTTVASDKIIIECQRYTIKSLTNFYSDQLYIEIAPPDTFFDITSLSETSAQLKIEDSKNNLALIWFYDQPNISGTGESTRIVGEFKVGCQSELENALIIEGLARKRAYTFCLVNEGVNLISPFNCRSYYTSIGAKIGIDERDVWLWNEDKALTICIFILLVIISMCIGLVGMFVVLRLYPTLLKGSKRVIVVNRSTGDVLIMPRAKGKSSMTDSSNRDSYETNTTIPQRRFSDTSIQSGRSYMAANNYEDIEYRWKMNVVNDMIYSNRVPKSPPPPLPKKVSQDQRKPMQSPKEIEIAVVDQKGNDYGYIG